MVYISAFLEATLYQKSDYLELFRDYRTGLEWLPKTIFLNQYEDSNCKYVCSFEEDINLKTTTSKTGEISTLHLTVWKESMVPLKWGEQDTRAVFVGWNKKEMDSLTGSYTITIEAGNEHMTDISSRLIFSLAESKESSNPHPDSTDNNKGKLKDKKEGEKKSDKKKDSEKKDSLDFTIILKDNNNYIVQSPLSHYSYLQPQLEAKIMKADFMTKTAKSEIVFQTFFLPLADFKEKNPAFNPDAIKEISFVFDRTGEGVIVIDNIGFWRKE
jgi:hypothetical protein